MRLFYRISFLLLILLATSCLGPREFSPIANYDLGKPTQTGVKLNIGTIDQNGPYNNKMMYRVSPERIEIQEYNRWTRSPDLILYDYLRGSFTPGEALILEGEILSFENNLTNETASFSFYYKITQGGNTVTEGLFQQTEPSTDTADEYASSMAKMARDLIQEISQKIKTLNN